MKLQQYEKDLTASILDANPSNREGFDFKWVLLDANDRKEFESLVKCVTDGTQLSLLDHAIGDFGKLCSDIHHTTYQVVFAPISVQLDVVQNEQTWSQFEGGVNSDLPDYSFTPQEYITQVSSVS